MLKYRKKEDKDLVVAASTFEENGQFYVQLEALVPIQVDLEMGVIQSKDCPALGKWSVDLKTFVERYEPLPKED